MIFKYLIIEIPIYDARESDSICHASQRTFNAYGRRHIERIESSTNMGEWTHRYPSQRKFIFIFKSYIYAGTGSDVTSKMAASIGWKPEVVASAAGEEVTRSGLRRAYLLLACRPAGLARHIALLASGLQVGWPIGPLRRARPAWIYCVVIY
jgi:hypothetical protein